jgi:hypothetical protein
MRGGRLAGRMVLMLMVTATAACESSAGASFSYYLWGGRGNASQVVTYGTTSTVREYNARARAGETIEVLYDVTIREGSVQIDIWRPMNIKGRPERLQSVTLRESRSGTMAVTVREHLVYEIRIRPYRFGGRYDVSWKVK